MTQQKENQMAKNVYILIGVMLVIGLISALLTYIRTEKMASPADIASNGLAALQRGNVIFFGLFMPVVVGPIAFIVYRGILARSPDGAETTYLLLATSIAIVFTILAALVFKMRGFVEFTALHIFYVAGFGWMMPRLLSM
jgi:magnesium-transporting ATPase (P-type)